MPDSRSSITRWSVLRGGIVLAAHLVVIAGLLIQIGIASAIPPNVAGSYLIWILAAIAITATAGITSRERWFYWILIVLDLALIAISIYWLGSNANQIWWGLLIAPFTAGLIYGWRPALGISLAAGALIGIGLWAGFDSESVTLSDIGWQVVIMVPLLCIAAALGKLAERGLQQLREWDEGRIEESDQSRLDEALKLLDRTVELRTNHEKDLVGHLSFQAGLELFNASLGDSNGLVGAFLTRSQDQLHIASSVGLSPEDERILRGEIETLFQKQGLGSEPFPLDWRSMELANAGKASKGYLLPLEDETDRYGVLLYAHPDPNHFSSEKMELLRILAEHTNASLQEIDEIKSLQEERERMTDIQEEARRKLARDLHDGPTQTIAAIAMRANFARRLMQRDMEAASEEILKVEDMARHTTKEIRHMLFTLRPLLLESRGLVAALGQLADKMEDTHGKRVELYTDPNVTRGMDLSRQAVIFFIAEEAITNATKHAEALVISVRLSRPARDRFRLEVADNGVGFNVGAVDADYEQRGSLGMVNMRERAELIDGNLVVESAEGQGTTITLSVPVRE
jgi:signal transduction histidine kinase